jgi:hypothetical protein
MSEVESTRKSLNYRPVSISHLLNLWASVSATNRDPFLLECCSLLVAACGGDQDVPFVRVRERKGVGHTP